MPAHDIIDNRGTNPADHINRILGSTEAAKFVVGYLSSCPAWKPWPRTWALYGA